MDSGKPRNPSGDSAGVDAVRSGSATVFWAIVIILLGLLGLATICERYGA